ncbi:hypothetical protein DDV21_003950 [Streptococcus chenjunshii]|uniref:Uncharacterized protein n=1 Tax=Streptococcus chenjunshii TaxID=2173853 RepID=A0A372KLR1_9STRE|nr:hypothetical protein DDV21_003950 [Streptococcus chenjunshii]RFU50735.1 hypothetical protein DDV22_07210 [Streptococcus chenjunshii]RFU52864.1 hypothetical protein DDV23_07435 [Streptococcus chenjunshii]
MVVKLKNCFKLLKQCNGIENDGQRFTAFYSRKLKHLKNLRNCFTEAFMIFLTGLSASLNYYRRNDENDARFCSRTSKSSLSHRTEDHPEALLKSL